MALTRTGDRRHPVTIESLVTAQTTFGDETEVWSTVATVFAEIIPLAGTERIDGSEVHANATHRLNIRFRPSMSTSMRIMYGSRTLQIISIRDIDERHHELELMCAEEVT